MTKMRAECKWRARGSRSAAGAVVAGAVVAFGGEEELGEDALDVGVVEAAAGVEGDAAMAAVEQGGTEMALEHLDAVCDGGGGDVELFGGAHEALVAGSGVEVSKALEGRKGEHCCVRGRL